MDVSHRQSQSSGGISARGDRVCYVNGRFGRESEAAISVFDHGLLYGDGVFDTVVVWNGRLFRVRDHAERLLRSMKATAIEPPVGIDELLRLTAIAVGKNGLRTAYVKWIVTRGSNDTPLMDPAGCEPNLIILVRPYIERFTASAETGIHLKTVSIRRTPGQCLDARIKSLNYLNLILAKLEAKAAAADEALLLDIAGNICEAPGYNVFVVARGRLFTPARDILEGITRASVIESAGALGIPVFAGDVGLYDAYTADEIFLTSTAGGLIPVTKIDGRIVGGGAPGPLFRSFASAYAEMLSSPKWGVSIDELAPPEMGKD